MQVALPVRGYFVLALMLEFEVLEEGIRRGEGRTSLTLGTVKAKWSQ